MDANKAFQMIEKAFSEWVEIKRSFCGLTLDGWGLAGYGGRLAYCA